MFNGHGQREEVDYVLKRQRDRNLVRDVKVHRSQKYCLFPTITPELPLLGSLAASVTSAGWKWVKHHASVAKQLRENPPNDDSVNEAQS